MAYGKDGSGRHLFYLRVLLLFGEEMETERKMFLCEWSCLGVSLQRQWWVQMAPSRQKDGLGVFLVWKHQICRDAVGEWPTGRSVEAAGACA